jgi:hypothetical protein
MGLLLFEYCNMKILKKILEELRVVRWNLFRRVIGYRGSRPLWMLYIAYVAVYLLSYHCDYFGECV